MTSNRDSVFCSLRSFTFFYLNLNLNDDGPMLCGFIRPYLSNVCRVLQMLFQQHVVADRYSVVAEKILMDVQSYSGS